MTQSTVTVWTVEEASAFLRTPVETLYYWRKVRKGPPAHKPGKDLKYLSDEVIAWLRGQA